MHQPSLILQIAVKNARVVQNKEAKAKAKLELKEAKEALKVTKRAVKAKVTKATASANLKAQQRVDKAQKAVEALK